MSASRSFYIDAANGICIHRSRWIDMSTSLRTQAQAWSISSWANIQPFTCNVVVSSTGRTPMLTTSRSMPCGSAALHRWASCKRRIPRPVPWRAPIPLPNQALPLNLCRTCMCQYQEFQHANSGRQSLYPVCLSDLWECNGGSGVRRWKLVASVHAPELCCGSSSACAALSRKRRGSTRLPR